MTAQVPGKQIGRSLPRPEARAKVSGRAEYAHTMRVPGMLICKLFRSTVAHGRIKSVDVSEACKVPGVFGVYTGEDIRTVIADPYYGPAFHDQPILALSKVLYVGEPVASVLAENPHVADQAVQQIIAEYEELPAVFDEVEAAENKVLVHDALKPASTFADLKHLKGVKGTNCALDFKLRRGDVDKAFASAAQVFEHTFKTQKVLHLAFEPLVAIADYKDDGVTITTASQSPSFVRSEIARLLGWPENRVRVKVPYLGGGYGSKLYIKMEALSVALSMLARRPVKVALTMDEVFYTITKHPSTFRIKTGVDKKGRIVARKCEVWWNGGAYADVGPRVTQKSGFTASGPYDIDNVSIDSYALYTNLPPAGALRGFGIPQLVWAYESHTDMIARAMGRDPLDFRRQNLLREGRPHATGTILKDAAIEKVLDTIADRLDWELPFDRGSGTLRRGRGLAVGLKAVIAPTTSVAIVNVAGDGSVTVYCGTVDMGQGSDTALAQIVGEVLNMQAETIRIVPRDTDVLHYDWGTQCGWPPKTRRPRSRSLRAKWASRKARTCRSPNCSPRNTACRLAISSAPAATSRITCHPIRRPDRRRTRRRSGWSPVRAPRSRLTRRPGSCASCA
jgi:CO/xanthine dehydrogenase Mo-binding subunit